MKGWLSKFQSVFVLFILLTERSVGETPPIEKNSYYSGNILKPKD